jgi:hypothetical protein
MPYFYNNDINLLFIHIPKTGGTSLQIYFSSKYNIPLNNKALCDFYNNESLEINSSMQHMTYNTIVKYSKIFNIDFDNIKIITIVRNPYERFVSDLFFFKLITPDNTKEEVFNILNKYSVSDKYDNHNLPQHEFITDDKGEIIKNIHILKTESLTDGMKNLGYTDFDNCDNVNVNKVNYYNYLSNESIEFINKFYHLDFILFNYDKI